MIILIFREKRVNKMENDLTLNNLAKAINNNASIAHIIKELKLSENNTFKLNFEYEGCDVYKVYLMFYNLTLSSTIICATSDIQYLTYMNVLDGWQVKITR